VRVGLNLLHLVPSETGGSEIYARRLVPALLAEAADLRLTLFAGREAAHALRAEPWANSVDLVELPVWARSRARRVLAEQIVLPRAARRARLDLLHNLFTTAPVRRAVPQVTTVLDLIYKHYPETHAGLLGVGLSLLVPMAVRSSRRLVALSEAGKRDLVELLGVAPERIDVTPLGPGLPNGVEPVAEAELRERFSLGDAPLLLTVSAKRPHKNLERLVDAVGRVQGAVLVAPGYATPFEDALRARASDRVRLTGWVDDATLEGLYRAATAFVFPSLAEGFGLPVLDALMRGVPVACSGTSSLPEVGGEAALYFDPEDVDAITNALSRVLRDADLRERLRRAGPERARRFTWERTARATVASYERALGSRS
jgi:glycosyltransferase involved in cell wall biosynthesis